MKKLLAILLAGMMMFSLAACTGGGSGDDGGKKLGKKGGIPIEEITTENWAQVVEDNFGLTIELPEGWEISKTTSLGGVHIDFTCKATDEEADAFFEGIFADLKAMSSYGVASHFDIDEQPLESIADAREKLGVTTDTFNMWFDETKSKGIHYSFDTETDYNPDTKKFEIIGVGIYLSQKGDWD